MKKLLLAIHSRVLKVTQKLAPLAPLLLRLVVGVVFVQSGWGKLHHLEKVISFFASLGIPAPQLQAPFVAGVEFVGGILMLVGLFTRYMAVPLAITMGVAIATAKWKEVESFGDFVGLQEFDYLVMFVALVILGAGPLSLDALAAKKFKPAG